ncbi:MAG TPA: hypothetical protein ENH31_06725 [Nitrospirae bacterium]|nr:hypothetical protein BMS3Abin10_02001 [bacterium BMS3Abin10]GBE37687.1 hypothetical protein BMS3Bbin08_00278 [bacterium BMS3Bbin08]HDH50550.1 hypothetical protein [Nitrospirota bacterium]HDK41019.1 hypothetical protein [Nitrospirota bacterium]HDK82249.1 hypothetical protein [Nitrospirota bacterium]
MDKKKVRTKYFSLKELRLSIAHMVLWSLLTVAFFTYMTIELGEVVEHNPLYIVAVFLGYAVIVVLLTMIFSHRFLGPFERLKMELRVILGGNYQKRLNIRGRDDIYLRSFVMEVNKLLDHFEKKHLFCKDLDSELKVLKFLIDREGTSKEELVEAVIALHDKIVLEEERK